MGARKKIWDLGDPADEKRQPVEVDMFAVDADEANKNDPARWTFTPPEGSASVVEIPGDWPDLPATKQRFLAIKLGAPNTIKAIDAAAFIQSEVDSREPKPAVPAEPAQ